jgi:hypothetical protein
MNRQNNQSRQKNTASYHQRQVRRNQIIIIGFSAILILSLILSLFVNV